MQSVKIAIASHQKIGHKRGVAGGLAVKATIFQAQGKRREARRHYNQSIRLAQEIGATWLAVVGLVNVAELEMSYGRLAWAATLLFFVMHHPTAVAVSRDNAQTLLDDLRAELPEAAIVEAETAAASLSLDEIIIRLQETAVER